MSTPDEKEAQRHKTLAIRIEDDLHQQVSTIAKLTGVTVTDFIRRAIEAHVQQTADSPELAAKAEALLADIEREAEERRQALSVLLAGRAEPGSTRKTRSSDQPPKG